MSEFLFDPVILDTTKPEVPEATEARYLGRKVSGRGVAGGWMGPVVGTVRLVRQNNLVVEDEHGKHFCVGWAGMVLEPEESP